MRQISKYEANRQNQGKNWQIQNKYAFKRQIGMRSTGKLGKEQEICQGKYRTIKNQPFCTCEFTYNQLWEIFEST